MQQDLYNIQPLDKEEEEFLNIDLDDFTSISNLEEEKERLSIIAKYSVSRRELIEELENSDEFDMFVSLTEKNGIGYKVAIKELIHNVVVGNIKLNNKITA